VQLNIGCVWEMIPDVKLLPEVLTKEGEPWGHSGGLSCEATGLVGENGEGGSAVVAARRRRGARGDGGRSGCCCRRFGEEAGFGRLELEGGEFGLD